MPCVSPHHERVVAFGARQLLDMASPSNLPWLKPRGDRGDVQQRGPARHVVPGFSPKTGLGLFIDDSQLACLEDLMWDQGYLDASQMAGAFGMLRPCELVWSRAVREYLLGERLLPNDLMAWNADGTRLPYRMHTGYLHHQFLRNDLFEGRYQAGGRPWRSATSRVPLFMVATVHDHVAPWRSVYKLNLVAERELTFLLNLALLLPSVARRVTGLVAAPDREPAAAVIRLCRVGARRARRSRAGLAGMRGRRRIAGQRGVSVGVGGVGRVAGLQALGQQDLEPGRDRDRHQRADQAQDGAADQAGQQHGGRAELDRPGA